MAVLASLLVIILEEIVCVVGLGYVGLPLACALSKKVKTIGFDVNEKRIVQLKQNNDWTNELTETELSESDIDFTSDASRIGEATFVIIAVPTPITGAKIPDLNPVLGASETVGRNLKKGAVVVLESTVYPGLTEEVVVPVLERFSSMNCGSDFFVGYSPERINPGDREHTLQSIVKVVSGMDDKTLDRVAKLYSLVCTAGVFRASSIKVAEAAKVIENVQRDLNIALMNELSVIFHKLEIPTKDVLDAAGSKWNFLKFYPGLVGGHCIGVDPYYLTFKAREVSHHPEIIDAGRRVNDNMPVFVVELLVRRLIEMKKPVRNSNILILGLTFKENVKDCRNSKIKDIIEGLWEYGINVIAHDPVMQDEGEVLMREFGVLSTPLQDIGKVDAVVFAVSHRQFESLTLEFLKGMMTDSSVLIDLRNKFDRKKAKEMGIAIEQL